MYSPIGYTPISTAVRKVSETSIIKQETSTTDDLLAEEILFYLITDIDCLKACDENNIVYNLDHRIITCIPISTIRHFERYPMFPFWSNDSIPLFFDRNSYVISIRNLMDLSRCADIARESIRDDPECGTRHASITHWESSYSDEIDVAIRFEGWALCISDGDMREILSRLEKASKDEILPKRSSEKSVAERIVREFDKDGQLIKSKAREMFGEGLSGRAFARAWERAAEIRPDLKRPGRRSSQSPSRNSFKDSNTLRGGVW